MAAHPVAAFFVLAMGLQTAGAGDLLRGGSSSSAPAPGASPAASGVTTPADTSQARANAQDALSRNTNALNAIRAMQDAARNTARQGAGSPVPGLPPVTNGLGIGGLQVAPGEKPFQGADLPTEATDATGRVNVGVRQTAQQALLDWQTFDIGKNTTLTFDQSAAGANANQWIAFNRITDPSANPTQILGNIKAQGQVYIINPNGVIFGGSSQVDTGSLTVSSLPINTNLIERGLLNNPDSQFLFSGLDIPAGTNGTSEFTTTPPLAADGRYGDVIVESGALLNTPVSADGNGGRVALIGANVTNAGTITTPNGQTILAAGLQVGLAPHDPSDPSLRGLDAFVGNVGTYGGSSSNSGLISAPRGSITITGKEVSQSGALTATTSVSLNGRIDLLANYDARPNPVTANSGTGLIPFLYSSSGTVSLGAGALLSILPEYESSETIIGTSLALRSRINLEGRAIHIGKNSTTLAPNAIVDIRAGEWILTNGGLNSVLSRSGGQAYLDSGSLINVAGTLDVEVPVSQNILSVDLRGAELANSPLQRNGVLRGQTIQVDIRETGVFNGVPFIGTPLADVSGFANLIQRGVGQLTTAGGSVTISAGNSAVVRDGAKIDVSGGSVAFQDGFVETTRLIKNGIITDISQADPTVTYDGIYTGLFDASNNKFGMAEFYNGVLIPSGRRFEKGYTSGQAGGAVSLTAPSLAFDGTLLGNTIDGEKQRTNAAAASSLTFDLTAQDTTYSSLPVFSPTPPDIRFTSVRPVGEVAPFTVDEDGNPLPLDTARLEDLYLRPDILTAGGFGNLTINNPDGSVTIPLGVTLTAPVRGAITINSSRINIDGTVIAPGGQLAFRSANLPLSIVNLLSNTVTNTAPAPVADGGVFRLGRSGVLDTRGLIVDDRLAVPGAGSGPLVTGGGNISIQAYSVALANGGRIDVSGGVVANAKGRLIYGDGDSVSVSAGRDLNVDSVVGGSLSLGAEIVGFSGARSGTLSLSASAIQVGGLPENGEINLIAPSFFSQGGFSGFSLSGFGLADGTPGVRIVSGTEIRPIVSSRIATILGEGGLRFLDPQVFEEGIRPAATLSFSSSGVRDPFANSIVSLGEVIMESGSRIVTDARGGVTFSGQVTSVDGTVFAPGGSITISGNQNFPALADPPLLPTVILGENAVLSATGKSVLLPDPFGRRSGSVLPGGTISVSGNILALPGSRLDVSGTSGVLDVPVAAASLTAVNGNSLRGRLFAPVTSDSNGGSITLAGSNMLHTDALLFGAAGGGSATGGRLRISSGRYVPVSDESTTADINLLVRQNGLVNDGSELPGLGIVSVGSFAGGGFDSLTLGGNIRFEENVSITATGSIRAATGGILEAEGNVTLTAPAVTLGQDFRAPFLPGQEVFLFTRRVPGLGDSEFNFAPTGGSGAFNVSASLIDIGNLSLQGVGRGVFNAPSGDVRGNGTLQAAADLVFNAGQVYPTTASAFSIFSYDAPDSIGSVSFNSAITRPLPFSGGGSLAVYASEISQSGTLRAPLGTITLGSDGIGAVPVNPIARDSIAAPITSSLVLEAGSETSVSGSGLTIPYGISPDGETLINPAGLDITTSGPIVKNIALAGLEVTTAEGSNIDISGGGDLLAYRFISGNGGTSDILDSDTAFAIIPGYGFDYVPYAPFNPASPELSGTNGFSNSTLRTGDTITLAASENVPAGTYTLLPARYALLPGSFLVSPRSGNVVNSVSLADGSSIVSGFRSNSLNPARSGNTAISNYEIASAEIVRTRSQFQDFSVDSFIRDAALSRETAAPRLPGDAGILSFTASTGLSVNGSVLSDFADGRRGALIDISSPVDILINASGTGGNANQLVLNANLLSSFNAESLLIGGLRSGDSTVTVATGNLTLDNAGAALTGSDIILAATRSITLADGSSITATGAAPLDDLTLEDGDGALVRVSAGNASVTRSGVTPDNGAILTVGETSLTGGSILLDSTAATKLNPLASLLAENIAFNSGQISVLLENPGAIPATNDGLVLSRDTLAALSAARSLSLRSYSNLDFYGTGGFTENPFETLTLEAAGLRGFNQGSGSVDISASQILLGNPVGTSSPTSAPDSAGSLLFTADDITFTSGAVSASGFAEIAFNATSSVTVSGEGSFGSTGNIRTTTPVLTGAQASTYRISALGDFILAAAGESSAIVADGLGANLTLEGATLALGGKILLPSGQLTLSATSGDLLIGGSSPASIDLSGTSREFIDTIRYTSGGTVNLSALNGSVKIAENASINVSAPSDGGDAGSLNVSSPNGIFDLGGELLGSSGTSGKKAEFSLDASALASASLANLDSLLGAGSFTALRDYRIRTGDVLIDGTAIASIYRVSADTGSIMLTGLIDASGTRGGAVDLRANGSLTLASGSRIDASAATYDAAGKGGSVFLSAGTQRDGSVRSNAFLDLQSGSTIDLGVAEAAAGDATFGKFSGTLHLRAPRNAANTDLQLNPIASAITGASAITVEGYRLYDLTGTPDGTITTALQTQIRTEAEAYLGTAGTTTAGYTAMAARLGSANPSLDIILTPGAEIINRAGDLTLGSQGSTATADWDLSSFSFRFGPRSAAGSLTLRAAGDLGFFNALSDGFSGGSSLWLAPLNAFNPLLPANSQSWNYRLAAGADLSAASFRAVSPLDSLASEKGTLRLGKNTGAATVSGGVNAKTSSIIGNNFQVIRTGSGDIDIHTGRSVQLLNPFASIYTAGTQVADSTSVFANNDFVVPIISLFFAPDQGSLGAIQQAYPVQYAMAGGNLTISAGANLERKTRNASGLIDDSSRQLPNNYLYRRGSVGSDGNYASISIGRGIRVFNDPAASTTWWVDYSNFFQSSGALGGGNVTLGAGNDITNFDAAIPTNARAPMGRPDPAKLLELGGGDLHITSGGDLSGGVYYVERGKGTITTGGDITTNATRSPSLGLLTNLNNPSANVLDSDTWLPTTLFVGKSSFDIAATGNVLLAPATNPFLLPQGINNKFWYKSFFSTLSADAGVDITSLGGNVTLRNSVTLPDETRPGSILQAWLRTQQQLGTVADRAAFLQPWLRLSETNVLPFGQVLSVAAPTLRTAALGGSINVVGDIVLHPSPSGQLELIAAGSINALQSTGISQNLVFGQRTRTFTAASVNVSDANPANIASPSTPLSPFGLFGADLVLNSRTQDGVLSSIARFYTESGSFTGENASAQTKQIRHAANLLHAEDTEPLRVIASDGSISGLELFSPKKAVISAGTDIRDISFYIQNLNEGEISVVSAGGNIIASDSTTPLRQAANATGNLIAQGELPQAGDIQISGPGTLEVLAGSRIDLGLGAGRADGTGTGITSIGNFRNPFLPTDGADILLAAGLSSTDARGLDSAGFASFISDFVTTPEGLAILAEIAPEADFDSLDEAGQRLLATQVFYRILRDTGRNFNDPESPSFRNYDSAFAAISSLFGEISSEADLLAQGRDIRTRSGGDISILAPGGGLRLANTTLGNPLAPPGIITEAGGSISIFTDQSVDIGIGRIFTLRGGDALIFSSNGDIAAGSSSRTVQAAPPTRVVIDPQSAAVQTDLAGLATGGGIGVLATVEGVPPGNVDLIAPMGIIDAGDAGIRVTGNINLAAVQVVNAGNISAGGASTGGAAATVSAPSVSAITTASTAAAAAAAPTAAPQQTDPGEKEKDEVQTTLSIIDVVVIGYGGGGAAGDEDEDEESE